MPSPAADRAMRRELYLLALYRVLEATLLAAMVFSPAGALFGEPRDPALAATVAVAYLLMSLVLLLFSRREDYPMLPHLLVGIVCDVGAATLATHAMPSAGPGIAMMLLFNVGAASLLLPLRLGLVAAALASGALVLQFMVVSTSGSLMRDRPLAEVLCSPSATSPWPR